MEGARMEGARMEGIDGTLIRARHFRADRCDGMA